MSEAGALLFARYAYPPNELGYCGPDGAAALLRADAPEEIARRARRFEGAWSYLEMIARANGLDDPLDEAVVQAYWVGNDLLDRVSPAELTTFLRLRFAGQTGGTWQDADARAVAHHSFQVFEVYPWAALLRRTGTPAALSVLDRCRVRTGTVREVRGESAVVGSRPMVWQGGAIGYGPICEQTVTWSVDGLSLLAGLTPGNRVALHWDWVCDVLTDAQCARIESLERQRLAVLPAP